MTGQGRETILHCLDHGVYSGTHGRVWGRGATCATYVLHHLIALLEFYHGDKSRNGAQLGMKVVTI